MKLAVSIFGAVAALVLAAFVALKLIVTVGDNAHPWLREEAYQAAVDAALRYHSARGDPSNIARDFTEIGARSAPTFLPCALSLAQLQAAPGRCTANPGPKPQPDRKVCRGAPCVVLGVTPQTWADPGARADVTKVLRNPAAICAAATRFAPNRAASARAAGCGSGRLERVHLVLALIPRRPHPCRTIDFPPPVRVRGGPVRSYKVVCEPALAAQIAIS